MLKGIDHRLNADVLACLRGMGHGDMVILCDTNFPAETVAAQTVTGRLLRMENLTAAQAAQAIRVSLGPLTTEEQVLRFAETWLAQYAKALSRAA